MKYYHNKHTDTIFNEKALKAAKAVYGEQVEYDIKDGYITELETAPDVVTLIRKSTFATAIHRYMEINNCTYEEAQQGIRRIVGTMKSAGKPKNAK